VPFHGADSAQCDCTASNPRPWKTLADSAADPFSIPDRILTISKAIGMPIPAGAPQAMDSQSLATG